MKTCTGQKPAPARPGYRRLKFNFLLLRIVDGYAEFSLANQWTDA